MSYLSPYLVVEEALEYSNNIVNGIDNSEGTRKIVS